MAGYHWAVTGAAMAFSAVIFLDFGADVWKSYNGLDLLTEFADLVSAAIVFGLFGWVVAFLIVWPLFLLTTFLAETLETRSLVYFVTCGALTGALLSVLLLTLPREASDQRSLVEVAVYVASSCVICGVSGAWLFWWKVIRRKPVA
ncbi:hypothetical protein [Microvirga sesbaniae]|uniref:hypothetical protein n=1 Tax=Microvirga sesbaniae TaxID=681392 RepID=UPI0021C86F82|nr:hypothetical protein [Microvirga sp. HBU67692]